MDVQVGNSRHVGHVDNSRTSPQKVSAIDARLTVPRPTPVSTSTATLSPIRPSQHPPSSSTLTPLRVAALSGSLTRRRSSYPPAPAPTVPSSLSDPHSQLDLLAELGLPELSPMWTPVGWDTLLHFDGESQEVGVSKAIGGSGMTRVRSDPGDKPGPSAGSRVGTGVAAPAEMARLSQLGGDRAWKTILASQVEIEGVGQIGVARVLQEVWRRGGGDQVTSQGLWLSIIMSLSLPEMEHPGLLPSPSAHSALALQSLYNLTLRHWEPSIFTGLLSSFGAQALRGDLDLPAMLGAHPQTPATQGGIFGVSTPQKELDMSQWTNLTPGTGADWSFLNSDSAAYDRGSSSLAYEVREPRRGSTARSIEDEGVRGLDEILAQMEEGVEAREVAAIQEQMAAALVPGVGPSTDALSGRKRSSDDPLYQMPTPETDSSDLTILSGRGQSSGSDRTRQASFNLATPPSSNCSPLTTSHRLRAPGGQSAIARTSRNAQLPTPTPSTQSLPTIPNEKKKGAMQLSMPMATFVPPPPMCMFFSPVFHDLQKGKVGVWKGDLEVRGQGGGKFSVLIVGEAATGHMWQSQLWPNTVVYPPESQADDDATATATMIPVSHLAREGFTPAAMGMVLCNDANIEAYVQMVQGLHAEGVAFHLSTPNRLPIVFLPAKFDSNDHLQRLGVAFMTKSGMPNPSSIPMSTTSKSACSPTHSPMTTATSDTDEPKKKRRRQSAPVGPLPELKTAAAKHKKRISTAAGSLRGGAIPEEEGEGRR